MAFQVGDRVEPAVTAHMPEASGPGTIVEIADSAAYGIRFDKAPKSIHRWYVGSELSKSDADKGSEGTKSAMALDIDPANGMVAVEFLDNEDDEMAEGYPDANPGTEEYNVAVFAMCLGVGKTGGDMKPNYKRGDTILVRQSARKYAIEVNGDVCLIGQYDVVGKVKA